MSEHELLLAVEHLEAALNDALEALRRFRLSHGADTRPDTHTQ